MVITSFMTVIENKRKSNSIRSLKYYYSETPKLNLRGIY